MTERSPVRRTLGVFFDSLATCNDPDEAQFLCGHVIAQLGESGVPTEVLMALHETLPAFVAAVVATRNRQDDLQEDIDRLRCSAARRLGRATRVMPDISMDDGPILLWVDDNIVLMLPDGVDPPPIGAMVEYAMGAEGNAVYFGYHEHADHAGLVRARLKSVEYTPDGRPRVEVTLRDSGDDSDTVVAICSDELLEALDSLEPGALVRVTNNRPVIAYVGPEVDEDSRMNDRMVTPVTPLPESEDNFIYSDVVLNQLNQVVDVIKDPQEAAKWGLKPVRALIFTGPTGVGKTTISRNYLGRELKKLRWQVLSVNTDAVTSSWYGESEKLMRRVLEVGADTPTLLIFDEIDSVLPKRGRAQDTVGSDVASRVFAVVADALGRAEDPDGPPRLVVFTSNYLNRLDPAIRSRIGTLINIPLPTPDVATQIATAYLDRVETEIDAVDMAQLAIGALNKTFIRVVMGSSEDEITYDANEVLSGRTLKHAVEAAAREAYFDGRRPVGTLDLVRHIKAQLRGNLADLGRDDLAVALAIPNQDINRITAINVDETVVAADTYSHCENRIRLRLVS